MTRSPSGAWGESVMIVTFRLRPHGLLQDSGRAPFGAPSQSELAPNALSLRETILTPLAGERIHEQEPTAVLVVSPEPSLAGGLGEASAISIRRTARGLSSVAAAKKSARPTRPSPWATALVTSSLASSRRLSTSPWGCTNRPGRPRRADGRSAAPWAPVGAGREPCADPPSGCTHASRSWSCRSEIAGHNG